MKLSAKAEAVLAEIYTRTYIAGGNAQIRAAMKIADRRAFEAGDFSNIVGQVLLRSFGLME